MNRGQQFLSYVGSNAPSASHQRRPLGIVNDVRVAFNTRALGMKNISGCANAAAHSMPYMGTVSVGSSLTRLRLSYLVDAYLYVAFEYFPG